jgi:signal peptidase I
LNSTKSIIKANKNDISLDTRNIINERIKLLEESLELNDQERIESSYSSLKNFYEQNLSQYSKSKLRQNVEAIVIALCLALLIRTFIVQPFKIPSGSMIPTLLIGDHLLVNKFIYGTKIPFMDIRIFPVEDIKRGDVIVFKFPGNDSVNKGVHYIKRAIGLPGDEVNIEGRDVYINGKKIKQVYEGNYKYFEQGTEVTTDKYIDTLSENIFDVIYKKSSINTTKGKTNFPITIPEGNIFVLGDNRDNSYDSRFWGFVPIESISGKAFLIHWSWNFDNDNIFSKVRWNRIFSSIN